MPNETHLTRRELIQITAGAAAAAAAAPLSGDQAAKFFSKDEFAMVDELTEIIIPADDHSPGARDAQVAPYIDSVLSQTWDERVKKTWRDGLASIEALSREMHQRPFMESSRDQRVALLERLARNEAKPETAAEHFFAELKGWTAHAYYTSKIGIHQEMEYKGNVYLEEFAGYEVK